MKRFSALIATTFIALGITTGALADTRQCDCACQCETPASPASFSVSPTAIAKPPPPQVQEAANGELDLRLLNSADVTVELKYPEIANGHTAGLYWTSGIQQYRTPVQTVKDDAKSVIFKIPNASVMNDLGQTVTLTASVGVGSDRLVISEPQTIKVINSTPAGQYPPPTVEGAPGNQVDIGALTGDLTVSVYYPPVMAAGQIARVLWRGATAYETAPRNVPDGNPLEFTIPHATVLASLGTPVTVSYEVTVDGQPSQPSDTTTLHIKLQTVDAAPVVPSANGGQLDLKNLAGQPLKVTYTYNGIAAGHTVGIRWAGNPVYDTPHPVIGATPRPLEFTIPYDKVKLEKDKTVQLTASVGIGDGQLAVSPALALKVIDTRPRGEDVAADLNARYMDTRMACDNNAPAYYCNGIIIRSTQNGNYDPWNPSPAAIKLGGVSFSYMRKDAYVSSLYHVSGFTFMPQEKAIAEGKSVDYLCIYAYDAGTLVGIRGAQGCGLKPRSALDGDVSTCRSVGVQTVAQWYAYTRTIPNRDYQCSLSTADATQFAASFQVRSQRPPNMEAFWNEMMVKLWPQNVPANLPLESFFYTTETGRAEAKIYQSKYTARTGQWLPVIRLNLSNLAASPFSYSTADQAIQP